MNNQNRVHFYNDHFFEVPNLLNCYWAGFIAADGSVSDKYRSFKVGLAEKDENHLRLFADTIGYKAPLLRVHKTRSVHLQLYGGAEKMSYDLENCFNIVANKSLVLKPPTALEFGYPIEFLKSFLIGFIDGDGCIKFCARDRTLIVDFFSGSRRFVDWIKKFLEINYCLPDKKIYSYGLASHLYRIQGIRAIKVLSDLKQIDVPKLQRKWGKV